MFRARGKNNRLKKLGRIGVLMGGPSAEREISLKSGNAVYESLKDSGADVVALDIQNEDKNSFFDLVNKKIDVAFIALHGQFGEDGKVQSFLDELNIPYTGSGPRASYLAMDKVSSGQIFQEKGLEVPGGQVITKYSYENIDNFGNGFPLVVKPAMQGSSLGLSIVDNKDDLSGAIELAFKYDERVILERYIKGREITVAILDDEPLPVIEIIPKNRFFDFPAKYQKGLTEYIVPAELPEHISVLAKKNAFLAHSYLGCFGCSRVDMILDEKNRAVVLEVNTIPGLTQTSLLPKAAKAAGIEFAELCTRLIELAYVKKK